MQKGTRYFRRFVKECRKMSPHIKFVPIQYGYYRMYWVGGGEPAYLHEVWKEMPWKGYTIEQNDIELVSQKYYEEYEDSIQATRKIKNYVEGYWDSLDTIRTRLYMLKNNKDFREQAVKAYRQVKVK